MIAIVAGLPELTVGELALAPLGSPLTLRLAVPENPSSALSETLKVVPAPAAIDWLIGVAASEKVGDGAEVKAPSPFGVPSPVGPS